MRHSKISVEQWARIVKQYSQGVSVIRLAHENNISAAYVYKFFERLRFKGLIIESGKPEESLVKEVYEILSKRDS